MYIRSGGEFPALQIHLAEGLPAWGSGLPEVSPGVQAVVVVEPAFPDVVPVVHVGDRDVLDAPVGLGARGLHRGAEPDDDEDDARRSGDEPLVADALDVLDVDFLGSDAL